MLSQEELKRLIRYDPETGIFTWAVDKGRVKVGTVAGCVSKESGYAMVRANNVLYRAHRLVWLYVHGVYPPAQLDHINMNRSDNSIANLREAINTENGRNRGKNANNTSGRKGVYAHGHRWRAVCTVQGKYCHLGLFATAEEASVVYEAFAKGHFGSFYRERA